jgi:2-polyprenyl-3-methyl-5-hydroxy-6-metoxy-1,4-benzoquinol methylase
MKVNASIPIDELVRYLEAPAELLPDLPMILSYLDELGPSPKDVYNLMIGLDLPQRFKILDLGCGKGAIDIFLAQQFNCSIRGIDAFPPFIEYAIKKAKDLKLGQVCEFECNDIRKELKKTSQYDVVIFVSVGDIYGDYIQTIGEVRKVIKPQGYLIIEDGFLRENRINRSEFHEYGTYSQVIDQLSHFQDNIIKERLSSTKEIINGSKRNNAALEKGAKELLKRYPEKEGLVKHYLEAQKRESQIIEQDLGIELWVIQKGLN